MKLGTSFSSSSTVGRARWAKALSCWKVKKSDSSRISGSRPCLNRIRYLTAECYDSLFFWNTVNFIGFSVIHVSQGSVASYVTCGGMSTQRCIANFLLSPAVKEFLKSVKIWQSYCQKFRGLVFFGTRCTTIYSLGHGLHTLTAVPRSTCTQLILLSSVGW